MNSLPPQRSKTAAASAAGAFILSFIKAKKDLQLYPSGNAAVTESIQKLLQCLQDNYPSEEVVEIMVEKDRLFVNASEPDKNDPRIKDLALSLFRRGVRKILLDPSIPPDEMMILLAIINLTKERISAAGGVEKLSKSRNIVHAVVEEAADLMILDGENFSVSDEPAGADDELAELSRGENPEAFGNIFVRIQGGDHESLERLQTLLKKPGQFSRLLERFAVEVRKVEGELDPVSRIDRLLKVLRTAGAAIGQVPSTAERKDLMQNLAMSVLNMSVSIREDLVNQGLVPNLTLKSIESDILSQFPASQLADALLENFQISGATSTIMQSYFNNLEMNQDTREELADALKVGLTEHGFMTPELDATLTAASGASEVAVIEGGIEFPAHTVLRSKHYPAEKVLFTKNERQQLRSLVSEEMKGQFTDIMAPALLELMRHENVPAQYPPLVAKVRLYLEDYLGRNNYMKAAELLTGLQEEYKRKKPLFGAQQLEPLHLLLVEYCGDERIEELAAQFRSIQGEGAEFERLLQYFKAAGAPAISSLMRLLEEEQSRHARLLICKMVARCSERNVISIAEKLKHPKWYVARNAVLILGQSGSPAAVPYLQKTLAHEDIRVRKETLKALAAIRSGEAVELLCSAIEDENPAISKAAMGWVIAIEAEQALPALQKTVDGKNIWKRDEEYLRLSIEALKSIGTEKAKESLEKLAHVRSFFRRRKAASIRSLAGTALEELSHD